MAGCSLPLQGVRVLELGGGKGELATRCLADLGADVVLVEDPAGSPARRSGDLHTCHETFNANKRSVLLDLKTPAERDTFDRLLSQVDILFCSLEPGELAAAGLDLGALPERFPHLVVTAFTHFGLTGPWRDWTGSEWVHSALGTGLSRSGAPGREPLVPPMDIALQNAAVQAAWATLVGYAQRLVHGHGDLVDVAVLEAVVQVSDPPYGMAGSAAGGLPTAGGPRGRVDYSFRYPYYEAADGWVRIAVLSPRQWAGMYAWLGKPPAFADPAWSLLAHRYDHFEPLRQAIAALVGNLPREQVITEAARFGVPAASVLTPPEVLAEPHFAARGFFVRRTIGQGELTCPDGVVELDERRAGIRTCAPALGAHTEEVLSEFSSPAPDRHESGTALGSVPASAPLPLAGVRVLDFGVIVAGGEAGRLLADLGADVIKVENKAIPDGSRQSLDGSTINVLFAWGNRNKRSIGIDVKSGTGAELIRRLVKNADVILSNFKPGTLGKLGLTYEQVRELNPGIVVVESSAFGHTGPWAQNPGYGPIVRAAVGVSHLWRYPDDPSRFCDDVTSYPDHAAARVVAISVLARLIARRRTGLGGSVHVAQTEVSLWQHSHLFAAAGSGEKLLRSKGNGPFVRGVFAARGDDEWVVVDVRTPDQQIALEQATEAGGENAVRAWLAETDPDTAMAVLQAAGVPAAKMIRAEDLLGLPQLVARGTFRVERHPLVRDPMPSEGAPALFRRLPRISVTPAPVLGQHTREIARDLLQLTGTEIDALLGQGVLQEDTAGLAELAAHDPANWDEVTSDAERRNHAASGDRA
ncbi:CaiB/BaiF CoA transferase family protein [Amycolatopsis jejuensis]|uniref:CaiB/BaiF CoA transferase family protein n=1 Tax=Amycolatopsis jejuensis TaxID=330084 RepID=UPI000AD11BC0|nr:CoA transferase [Amycolatopsis jejuensis]